MRHALVALGVIAGLAVVVSPSAAGQEVRKPAAAAQAASSGSSPVQPIKKVTDVSVNTVWADGCRLWIEVKNTGNVTVDKLLRERVWVDGVVKDQTQTHYVLKPGATFSHGVGADPGVRITGLNRVVKAVIDADGVLDESNESNNEKQVTLSCRVASAAQPGAAGFLQDKPDLVVTFDFKNITQEGSNADGQPLWAADIEFTVTNRGSADAGPSVVHMEQGSGPEGAASSAGPNVSMPAIAAGASVTKMFGRYRHAGSTQVYRATVDFLKKVAESNESNNQFVKPFPQ